MTHDVFICYAQNDKRTADKVCVTLESCGIKCWIAPRNIPGGYYSTAILRAIKASKVMVLVLSSASNKSSHVVREVGLAVDNGITICPLRIEEVKPSETLEYFISSEQWLDGWEPPIEKHLKKLAENVRLLLRELNVTLELPKGFDYHLYISYSQTDHEWATALQESLEAKGIVCFPALAHPRAGAVWSHEVTKSLTKSQHLVVLWSDNAKISDWVRQEIYHFQALVDSDARGNPQESRRLLFVLLQGEASAFANYQMINDIKYSGDYARGIEQLDQQVWVQVINKLVETIDDTTSRKLGAIDFLRPGGT